MRRCDLKPVVGRFAWDIDFDRVVLAIGERPREPALNEPGGFSAPGLADQGDVLFRPKHRKTADRALQVVDGAARAKAPLLDFECQDETSTAGRLARIAGGKTLALHRASRTSTLIQIEVIRVFTGARASTATSGNGTYPKAVLGSSVRVKISICFKVAN